MTSFKAITLFPEGSQVTTGFGWDVGPKNVKDIDPLGKVWPRIHPAIDRVGPGDMRNPIESTRVEWRDSDSGGNSLLRLIGNNCELRLLHINKSEFDKDTWEYLQKKKNIQKGMRIAPCGNTGISFGNDGGRHVHYSFLIVPGVFDSELNNKFGEYWNENKYSDLVIKYGDAFTAQCKTRAISWINSYALRYWDRYWGRSMIVLNTEKVFE